MALAEKVKKRRKRHRRVRKQAYGTSLCPRLCVFRSNRYIYAQIIDDQKGHTLVGASGLELGKKLATAEGEVTPKIAYAYEVGKLVAERAVRRGIRKVVFDRGGYRYHGRVKALAEGARKGGLNF